MCSKKPISYPCLSLKRVSEILERNIVERTELPRTKNTLKNGTVGNHASNLRCQHTINEVTIQFPPLTDQRGSKKALLIFLQQMDLPLHTLKAKKLFKEQVRNCIFFVR